ncbi:MAG TPA: hypothetical protein VGK58_11630 [Lacipirellulaceae bacterium]
MRRLNDNPYLMWFKLAAYLGIIVNLLFAIPAVFCPRRLLDILDLPYTSQTVWLRDVGGLLFFLTLMYVAAARNPFRYAFNAAVMVVGRVAFAAFWFWVVYFADYPPAFLKLGIADLVIAVLQSIAYVLMMRHEYLQPELSAPAAAS